MKLGMAGVIGAALVIAGCGDMRSSDPQAMTAREKLANAKRLKRACGSSETYDRLKSVAFEQAAAIRGGMTPLLDALSANTVVRMEEPLAKSRDEALNVTVCTGKFILELPPGTEDAFDGNRRVQADIEFAAQEAVDGSGLVYQMQGAEPIIYRLAAIDLKTSRPGSGRAQPAAVAAARAPGDFEAAQVTSAPPAAWPRAAIPAAPPRPATPLPQAEPRRVATAQPPAPVPARPSFNCRSARSSAEQRICGNAALAARDRAMSAVFYQALAGGDAWTRSTLRSSRERFLAFRESCADDRCIAQAYDDRIAEIREIAAARE